MKCDEQTGVGQCPEVLTERIRYFTGRHMTARDFQDADTYHRSFRYLHNRILHGWGIACGLQVEPHPRRECRRDRVVVRCGLAIDCCGREIIVRKDVVSPPIPWKQRPDDADKQEPVSRYVLLLCLKYTEICVEKVPVLYSPNACSTPAMEDGRIRECYELCWRWVKRDELSACGWDTPEGCEPPDEPVGPMAADRDEDEQREEQHQKQAPHHPPAPRPCPDEPMRPACCLDFACPKDHCVALAVLDVTKPEDMDAISDIEISGRRSIVQAREHLTHICWISWPHGGIVRSSEIRTLRVRFDRPLLDAEHPHRPGPRGINERTFVVQYGEQIQGQQVEDLDFVEYRRPPYLTPDGRTAVYEVRKPLTYRSHILQITVRCDFLLDCRKNPVDGDHLRGRLPTGDGVPGGTFESWVRVVDDDEYVRLTNQSKAAGSAAPKE
jgi:hypothetical protein